MREILPGVHHWTVVHPSIGMEVSSYYLEEERTLIDPLIPSEGIGWFAAHGPPRQVLLTSGLHTREARLFQERYECPVRIPRAGLIRVEKTDAATGIDCYDWGEELPGGIRAFEIGALCDDEGALVIPGLRAVALADGIMREREGPLALPPDELLGGEDLEAVKHGLRQAYARLIEEHDFDHLLLAHGNPCIGDAKEALKRVIG